ncbi:MAG: homoserine O-acetyltransferase [Candidatus Lindowbacteria bacterium]|nr:homoserine O-acetyltransferase [Candidatus Lindowbacteria bacterium]
MNITRNSISFENGLDLESGERLGNLRIQFETYGELNEDRSNAILICHHLASNCQVAGKIEGESAVNGWWDPAVGPGKVFNTDDFFVICSDVLGGWGGSTGPSSIDPETGKSYAASFPVVTIRDMVNTQKRLIDHLGITQLLCVVGASFGGFQALDWSVAFPGAVKRVITFAASSKCTTFNIALFSTMRNAIMSDPSWNGGNYYDRPDKGSCVRTAAALSVLFRLTPQIFEERFGRTRTRTDANKFSLRSEFLVEEYLNQISDNAAQYMDPNSILFLTKAQDYFDMSEGHERLTDAFRDSQSEYLFINYENDLRNSKAEIDLVVQAINDAGREVDSMIIKHKSGPASFLWDIATYWDVVRDLLRK